MQCISNAFKDRSEFPDQGIPRTKEQSYADAFCGYSGVGNGAGSGSGIIVT